MGIQVKYRELGGEIEKYRDIGGKLKSLVI